MAIAGIFGPQGVPAWYRKRPDGALQFDGTRPGPDWHAHGYFAKWTTFIGAGTIVQHLVFKQRWRLAGTNTTQHSRPPDDLPHMTVGTVIVVLFLALRLGVFVPDPPDIEPLRSDRTIRRWLGRALRRTMHVQQAIRHELIERCEPRPVESLFKAGLSPPQPFLHAHASDPSEIQTLGRAFAMLVTSSIVLSIPIQRLLAGARGRWTGPENSFPL